MFAARLRTKSVNTAPANTVDDFGDQLDSAVIEVLNELAPLKTCLKRCGKTTNKWLSDVAVEAKSRRRRLERS
jgi:hypothetical protein